VGGRGAGWPSTASALGDMRKRSRHGRCLCFHSKRCTAHPSTPPPHQTPPCPPSAHLRRVDDAHVHARLARVVQEGGVEGAPHRLVAAEGEGNVGHAAADLGAGAHALDLARGADEVHGVVVVLRQASAHGEDVGVEDDVLGVETNVLHQDAVCALADAHLPGGQGWG